MANLPSMPERIQHFYKQIGAERSQCRACGRTIWFVQHANGKRTPYTDELVNHFVDCGAADRFRREPR